MSTAVPARRLHRHPPLTPAGVLLRHRFAVAGIAAAFAALALMAIQGGDSPLLAVDEPVQRSVARIRAPWLDSAMHAVSQLGGVTVIVLGLAALLLVVWHRCRSLAAVLLAAAVARPLLEWGLKLIVGRARPDMDRLVRGEGFSFPSGHVMAAIALWGLLPPVVALVSGRRSHWWASVAVAGTTIGLVAASRVYLGVHWLSDVVGAMVLGCLYLLAVEALLEWHHERRPCAAFERVETRERDEDDDARPVVGAGR